jgi:hypothetical protein
MMTDNNEDKESYDVEGKQYEYRHRENLRVLLPKSTRKGENQLHNEYIESASKTRKLGIIKSGGVDMAFLKHVPFIVKAMFSIVWALLI